MYNIHWHTIGGSRGTRYEVREGTDLRSEHLDEGKNGSMLGNKALVVVIPAQHRKQSPHTSAVAKLLVYEVHAALRY
jgi:hypothetical protein